MPLEAEGNRREPAGVVVCPFEDDFSKVVIPRLRAAGADLDRVVGLTSVTDGKKSQPLRFPEDIRHLEAAINQVAAGLVIIDPLMAVVSGTTNPNHDRVRLVLLELKELAERTQATILGVRHFKKGEAKALYKGAGNIAILGTARAALMVGEDGKDPSHRILAMNKGNMGRKPDSIRFGVEEVDVEGAGPNIRIVWRNRVQVTADEVIQADSSGSSARGKQQQAANILRQGLERGPRPERVIKAVFKSRHRIGDSVVDRAKRTIGIESVKFRERWYWGLPGTDWDTWREEQIAEKQHTPITP
jgi:hypothetical protein